MAYCNKIIIILFCVILIFLFFPTMGVKAVSETDFYNLPPSTISDEIKNVICKLEPFYSKTDGRFTYDFIVNMQQNDAQYSIVFILRDTINNFENKMPLVNYFDESYPYYWYQVLFSSDENTQYNYIQYFYDIPSQTITGGSSVTSNQVGNNSIVESSESIPFWSSIDLYKGSTGVIWNFGITDATRQQLIDFVSGSGSTGDDYTSVLAEINAKVKEIRDNTGNTYDELQAQSDTLQSILIQLKSLSGAVTDQPNYSQTLQNVQSAIKETNSKMDTLNSSVQEQGQAVKNEIATSTNVITDTLTDNNTDNITNDDLPTTDITDTTESGFNNIFRTLESAFTDDTEQELTLTLPFVDKDITISRDKIIPNETIRNFLSVISSSFWLFLVSIFVVKDMAKRFNKIKSGDIESVTNSNIKEDIL